MQPLDAHGVKLALDDLNTWCLDSWCEGEFSYKFKDFTCGKKQCKLSFTAIHENGNRFFFNVTVLNRPFSPFPRTKPF